MTAERDAVGNAPLVYVASPITADPWGCVRRATEASRFLAERGVHAYLPQLSVLHEMVDPQPYEHWIAHGLTMLERCDGFLRLNGDSSGADREYARARELELPVLSCQKLIAGSELIGQWLGQVSRRAERRP